MNREDLEPEDKELSEEELDGVVGGAPPPWAGYHGKKDQPDEFSGY